MSASIDKRIVEMEMDNTKFEKNAKQTIDTLDRLKQSLDFSEYENVFKNLGSNPTNLNSIGGIVDELTEKFSYLSEIATGAFRRIGARAADMAINLTKSLSIDLIDSGFGKYEQELKSVQTIIAATGLEIEKVENELSKIQWYTDETSYDYTSLVKTIQSFTAQDIELEKAVKYVQGIGNMAGLAGVEASQATHAMEGFAKAMALGKMNKQTWNTYIKTSGLITAEIKRQFINASREIDPLLNKLGDDFIDVSTFEESLSSGWLNSDVMKLAFANMSKYSDILQEFQNEVGAKSASEAMEQLNNLLDDQGKLVSSDSESFLAFKKVFENFSDDGERTVEELTDELNLLLSSQSKLAFESAQVYRTFTDAVNTTKTSVTTAWQSIFKDMFGNVEEARETWTRLGDWMLDFFAQPIWDVEAMFAEWKDLGGRTDLIEGFANLGNLLTDIVADIKKSFSSVIKTFTGKDLVDITKRFREFTSSLKIKNEAGEWTGIGKTISNTIKILASLLKNTVDLIKNFWNSIEPLRNSIKKLVSTIIDFYNNLTDKFIKNGVEEGTTEVTIFAKAVDFLSSIFDKLSEILKKIKLPEFIGKVSDKIKTFFGNIVDKFSSINILETVLTIFEKVVAGAQKVIEFLIPLFSSVGIGTFFITLTTAISNFMKVFGEQGLLGLLTNLDSLRNNIGLALGSIGDALEYYFGPAKTYANGILKLGFGLLALAAALKLIESIDAGNITKIFEALTLLLGEIAGYVWLMGKVLNSNTTNVGGIFGKLFGKTKTNDLSSATNGLIKLGVGLLILAGALKVLAGIELTSLVKALAGLFVILMEIAAFSKVAGSISSVGSRGIIYLAAGILIMAGAVALLSILDPNKLVGAFAVMSLMVLEMGLLTKALSSIKATELLSIGASMVLLASSLLLISGALSLLTLMNPEKLLASALIIGVVLAEFVAALGILSYVSGESNGLDMLAISGSLLILAAAIGVLTPALIALSLVKPEKLITALVGIGMSLLIFGLAVNALKGSEITILALGAGLALLGTSVILVGGGLMMISAALISLSAAGSAVIGFINIIVTSLIGFIPLIIEAIGKGIIRIFNLVKDFASTIVDFAATIITSILEAIRKTVPQFFDTLEVILDEFDSFIFARLPYIIEDGIEILRNLCVGLVQAIPMLTSAVLVIIVKFLEALADGIPDIIQAGIDLVVALIDGLADGIKNNSGRLVDSFIGLGEAAVEGLIDGLVQGVKDIGKSIIDLGKTAINGLKEVLGIASPSKEFMKIGKFADQGLAKGIDKYSVLVDDASEELGKKSINSLSEALAKVGDGINDDMDMNPTITPVLDLSNIESGSGIISSLLNGGVLTPNMPASLLQNGGSLAAAGTININLNNTFDIRNGQNIDRNTVRSWSNWIVDDINEELGRRI